MKKNYPKQSHGLTSIPEKPYLYDSLIAAYKIGFEGWERCTAKNGDEFLCDANLETYGKYHIFYFIYQESESGMSYESTEIPSFVIELDNTTITSEGLTVINYKPTTSLVERERQLTIFNN